MMSELKDTAAKYVLDHTVQDLFVEQVRKAGDSIAVEHAGKRLTYRQLNSKANQLARFLVNQGVGPDRVVGICIERSLEMVIGLLGILKAGGAYLPLDPSYPRARLQQMLADSSPELLITETELTGVLPSSQGRLIVIDQELRELTGFVEENVSAEELGVSGENLAYVIYTSGSTGRPKGIAMHHRAMVNLIQWHRKAFDTEGERSTRTLQFAALSFDVAFQEIFSTLCTGGTLILMDEWIRRDVKALTESLVSNSIHRLFVPPAMLYGIAEHCMAADSVPAGLRDVITAGEQLRISGAVRDLFRRLPGCKLHNHYGPAETHVVTAETLISDSQEWPDLPPIGRPIANVQVHILDGQRQPLPLGATGEIYISGVCVSRGYLHQSALTGERFIPNPFSSGDEAVLYKTGDLGRWRADGALEYLGRNDDQVKIRGFRIELAEVEVQLGQHPLVKDVVVIAREDVPGQKRLVAYVAPRRDLTVNTIDLRSHLKDRLPEYMVPSAFVLMDRLPLTPSGKVDRRALPAPETRICLSTDYEAPRGSLEQRVAALWQEVLRAEAVGRNDDFFELGGHSLLAVQLLARLRAVGLAADPMTVYLHPTLAEFARALGEAADVASDAGPSGILRGCDRITPDMLTLVELEQAHIDRIASGVPGGASNIQDIYPLAPLQEGMLFHHLLNGKGADAYVIPMLFSLASRDTLDRFIAALQQLIDRHDILRTAIVWEALPQPVQVVYRNARLPVEHISLQGVEDQIGQLQGQLRPEVQRLDLLRAPLMRLQIASHPYDARWFAVLQVHHLIGDHESEVLILNEVSAIIEGNAQRLCTPTPYRDHVARALAYARGEDMSGYFRERLGDVSEPTAAYGLTDVYGDGTGLVEVTCALAESVSRRTRSVGRRLRVSSAALFHAAWALVLSRLCGRDDVVFGTLVLGRAQDAHGERKTIGSFINTLPIRVHLYGRSARTLVEEVHRSLGELLQRELASLAMAQRCSGINSSAPLFTALLNYRYTSLSSDRERWQRAGFELLALREWTNYPIVLAVDDQGEAFSLSLQTDRRIDAHRTLEYVRTALEALVEALECSPEAPALSLRVLSEAEQREVIDSFNATTADYPGDKLIHELFEEQVRKTPDAIAVQYERQTLSYVELNERANRLARYLQGHGVGPDRLVGVCVERSLDMVVGLLGILKSGGAYVPLDPAYPGKRLKYLLDDAAPTIVLTQERLRKRLPKTNAVVITLDGEWEEIRNYSGEDFPAKERSLELNPLAYVIYTSGSTGEPKGVMVEHRSVVLLWRGLERLYGTRSHCAHVALNAPITFDASVQQLVQLLSGRRVTIIPDELRRDAATLLEMLAAESVQGIDCTPSQLKSWVSAGILDNANISLNTVLVGGEQIEPELWRDLSESCGINFYNVYGPTECTVDSTSARVKREDCGPNIGRPMENRRVYILDSHGNIVPVGVYGEIYIGGAGVGRGYWRRPVLTAERFLLDRFTGETGARMYRTGDIGRWRPDGTIEFAGRNDQQVKIRGYRIELGEIEACLADHPDVREAAVIAREDGSGEKRLVAYLIARDPTSSPRAAELREHLRALLPEHMIPVAFVHLQKLPLTGNGKLDKRALPAPDLSSYATREYEAPRGDLEESLARLWEALLRVERIGRSDNFFELGGNSLLAMRVIAHVSDRFGVDVPLRFMFDNPTFGAMASLVSQQSSDEVLSEAS